jgi:hypothetical protein
MNGGYEGGYVGAFYGHPRFIEDMHKSFYPLMSVCGLVGFAKLEPPALQMNTLADGHHHGGRKNAHITRSGPTRSM